jgi:two-component system, sensor histidine kinase YesM
LWKSMQFQSRLFLSLAFFALTVMLLVTMAFYLYTEQLVKKNLVEAQDHTAQKVQEQLDALLTQADNISISVNASDLVMNLLQSIPEQGSDNYFDVNRKVSEEVHNYLFSITALKPMHGRISLVSKYGDFVDFSNLLDSQFVTKLFVRKLAVFERAMSTNEYKFFLSPHQEDWSSNGKQVFSIVRPLRDTNYKVQGFVEVSYYATMWDAIFQTMDAGNLQGAVLDANNQIIYNNTPSLITESWLSATIPAGGNLHKDTIVRNPLNAKDYIVNVNSLVNTDWKVLLIKDMTVLERPIRVLRNITVMFYTLVLIIILSLLYLYTRSVTKPIRQLKKSVLAIDMESLRLRNTSRQKNEIALLGQAFQDLLDEVKQSINRTMEAHTRETKAQMLALQAQMNPHFLYNTLAVIGAYGLKKGNRDVMQMCANLSDMLRYTVVWDEGKATVRDELHQSENYLKLMAYRFESALQYTIDCDQVLAVMQIPKLSIEPLIENAFEHGFVDVEPPWILQVKGSLQGGRWQIEVMDNGRGFDADVLVNLRRQMLLLNPETIGTFFEQQNSAGGIGLMNTYARLYLIYGDEVLFKVDNLPQGGAVVRVGGHVIPS